MRRVAALFGTLLLLVALSASGAAASSGRAHHRRSNSVCRSFEARVARARRHHRRPPGAPAGCRAPLRAHAADVTSVTGPLVVGLNDGSAGWGGASTGPRLDAVTSQTGTSWVREEFLWSAVEPSPGTFDFSYYDHYMLLAAEHGLHVLALLDGSPSWAASNPNAIPSDPNTYAQFVAAFIARYGPHGSFWQSYPSLAGSAITTYELWNEPYFSSGNGGDYDPAAYAQLVRAAAIAGRAVDPSVTFLLEAEMQSEMTNGQWVWWVDALYQAVPDLNSYVDGVAVHDYGANTTSVPEMVPGKPYDGYGHILRIENLRQQFIAHDAGSKPFWITEAGWSTCTDSSSGCVNESQQASNLQTLFSYVDGPWRSFVQAAFIYSFQDGTDPSNVQDGYGLTHLDGTAKPALAVFRQAVAGGA
jgi:polysaccharide biosynthesis protein PslG